VTDLPADLPRPTWRFRVVAALVIAACWLARWRFDARGVEHVPSDGGAVVVWNHHSHVDFLVTAVPLYRRLDRPIRFLAMQELWSSRTFGWVPRFADAVPVDRHSDAGRERSLRMAVEAARDGHLVFVAPEATISPSFELLPFRAGAARIAQAAGVPLVPSVSWGSHRLVTTGHPFSLRRGFGIPVTVRFEPPVRIGPDDDPVAVTDEVRTVMARRLDEVQRTYPDGTPAGAWWVPARLGGGAPAPGSAAPAAPAPGSAASAAPAPDPAAPAARAPDPAAPTHEVGPWAQDRDHRDRDHRAQDHRDRDHRDRGHRDGTGSPPSPAA
jgi:1-acyl-sn-glycerol-3-phosphate acyltransferase